jgi:cytidylate kinase
MAIITISRLYGSGGSEVAALLSRELGWDLLDNAIIDEVAARTGLTAGEVAEREERVPSLAERLVEAMTMGTQEMLSPIASANLPPTDERLLEVTRHVIEEAAHRGPVIIVGRGAQEMLGSREDVLSVFCYAPRDALIARTMEREQVDGETATKLVDEHNKRRSEWAKAHWDRDWLSMEHYDLCVNTKTLGITGAMHVILDTARRRFVVS